MAQIFEFLMLLFFGISWPFNIAKSWKARTARGKSLLFEILILIGYNYIKLLLEITERYVVTFVLMYLSPLASATIASPTTNGIYKKFFTMFT